MRLRRFNKDKALVKLRLKRNKSKYIKRATVVMSFIFTIIGLMYLSFAKYTSSAEFVLVDGVVGEFGEKAGTLINGDSFNVALKRLSGTSNPSYYNTYNTNITSIEWSETAPAEEITTEVVSTSDSRSEERRVGKECSSRWSPYH